MWTRPSFVKGTTACVISIVGLVFVASCSEQPEREPAVAPAANAIAEDIDVEAMFTELVDVYREATRILARTGGEGFSEPDRARYWGLIQTRHRLEMKLGELATIDDDWAASICDWGQLKLWSGPSDALSDAESALLGRFIASNSGLPIWEQFGAPSDEAFIAIIEERLSERSLICVCDRVFRERRVQKLRPQG